MGGQQVSDAEKAAAGQVVRDLYERWGETAAKKSQKEYGDMLGNVEASTVSDWINGIHVPSGMPLLRMLRAARVLGPNFELPVPAEAPAAVAALAAEKGESTAERAERLPPVPGHEQTESGGQG